MNNAVSQEISKFLYISHVEKFHIGNHGGVSKEEKFVPLIVVKT